MTKKAETVFNNLLIEADKAIKDLNTICVSVEFYVSDNCLKDVKELFNNELSTLKIAQRVMDKKDVIAKGNVLRVVANSIKNLEKKKK